MLVKDVVDLRNTLLRRYSREDGGDYEDVHFNQLNKGMSSKASLSILLRSDLDRILDKSGKIVKIDHVIQLNKMVESRNS